MGNDTSRATGTDFDQNQKNRAQDAAADDLPSIPYLKQKRLNDLINATIKQSIWFANFKRAYRGYLRMTPERNQVGTMMRIQTSSVKDADQLGLPKDSFEELLATLLTQVLPELNDDTRDFLRERNKISAGDSEEKIVAQVATSLLSLLRQIVTVFVEVQGKKIYDKYSRGADAEISDIEIDPETKARLQREKEERLRQAAEERARQAEEWKRQAAEEDALQQERERIIRERQAEMKRMKEQQLL